jgi:DNA-directed RNA polymerase specialized sigma24 family protein
VRVARSGIRDPRSSDWKARHPGTADRNEMTTAAGIPCCKGSWRPFSSRGRSDREEAHDPASTCDPHSGPERRLAPACAGGERGLPRGETSPPREVGLPPERAIRRHSGSDLFSQLQRARNGDERGLERFCGDARRQLMTLAGRRLAGGWTAAWIEDVVQDSLVDILRGYPRCRARTESELRAWIHAIGCRNVAALFRREGSRAAATVPLATQQHVAFSPGAHHPAPPDPPRSPYDCVEFPTGLPTSPLARASPAVGNVARDRRRPWHRLLRGEASLSEAHLAPPAHGLRRAILGPPVVELSRNENHRVPTTRKSMENCGLRCPVGDSNARVAWMPTRASGTVSS